MPRLILQRFLSRIVFVPAVRTIALGLVYATVVGLSITLAYQLRFDFNVPERLRPSLLPICAFAVVLQIACMAAFHQFDGLLSYFSTPDLKRLALACTCGVIALGAVRLLFGIEFAPPRSVILTHFLFCVVALTATRLTFRHVRQLAFGGGAVSRGKVRRIGIVGAGDCGAALAKELLRSPWLALQPIAFFDDDRGPPCSVHGILVVGRPERIGEIRDKLQLDEVIIAMPAAPARRVRDILQLIHGAGLPCRTVPSMDQLATGRVRVTNLRPLEIQDLLGRTPVEIKHEAVREALAGRTVMITGAGGSIGSELCRQVLSFEPAALLLVERCEPQLFAIEQELRASPHGHVVLPLVGDITRGSRMRELFRRFHPEVVFHAAAHKHVPMMEIQPEEAIRNNVFGTAEFAELAIEFAVQRFIFVSTDKAVNPTSVMGATKRLAEMYLQSLAARQSKTQFMAVRFGNVLGSSGSVVPTFARQIAAGGPVTVTHPEVTRFFMTIPEAVSLVLQSSTLGRSGDIFVLDMGNPVKILDLALQMISLSGYTPNEDIEIVFTGLRPGEKLYEELSHRGEDVTQTEHRKILRLVTQPNREIDMQAVLRELANFLDRAWRDCAWTSNGCWERRVPQALRESTSANWRASHCQDERHPADGGWRRGGESSGVLRLRVLPSKIGFDRDSC